MSDKCDFEYGEKIEVSDDGEQWREVIFVAYSPEHTFPFGGASSVRLSGGFWKFARRSRPDLKPGQPILVWRAGCVDKYLRFFKRWDEDGVIASDDYWDHFAALKNYDYSAPIDGGI